jgi:hypothetical protein
MKSVAGLFVHSHDALGPFVLLQCRGEWDYEKNRPESYPGCVQATASGGLEPEDADADAAMRRETRQELGDAFADLVFAETSAPLHEWHCDERERHATFYLATVPEGALALIRLHPSSGGLVRVRPGARIIDMYVECTREEGMPDRHVLAAFQEVIEAVPKAFALANAG